VTEFFARAFADSGTVRLVAEVPELFEHLHPRARHDAQTRAVVPALQLRRGHWDGRVPGARDVGGYLGLLVLEGTMLRNVHVTRQPRSELVGRGDLARPWEHDGAAASLPFDADWRVLEPARLAVLDERFLTVACRWPSVVSAILGRAVQRAHVLALQLAISDVRHIKPRLLLLFWHLADRWGRMGRDGVAIPLRLTHEVIAQLIGAQRPTVSTALQALAREGLLTRAPDRTWLLDPRSAQEDGQGRMLLSLRKASPAPAGASPARPAIQPARNGLSRATSARTDTTSPSVIARSAAAGAPT
jgi:CRP/FNR family cyclic AMP-dependent transcriptional regulator